MKYLDSLLVLVILIFSVTGCLKEKKPEIVGAEIIEYKVEYMEKVAGSVPTNILPRKMTLVFADDKAMNNIEGFFGQFSLTYIADLKDRTVTSLLKVFDKKYYHEGKEDEPPVGIALMNGMELVKTENHEEMINFNAEQYILHLPNGHSYDIWGTTDIKIKDPNINTPYKDLDHVLLQFYTELSVLKMLVKAQKHESRALSYEIFTVPDDYEEISRENMNKILEELFK